jgi:selenocysteine lyase/cysteine desulfurase
VISFYFESIHYNLVVKLLSDRYGVQVRGGCVCAGTYGHFLLHVGQDKSKKITEKINNGDLSEKPGWVRLSIHPTMKDSELRVIIGALKEIGLNHKEWGKDYTYNKHTNEFRYRDEKKRLVDAGAWFNLE